MTSNFVETAPSSSAPKQHGAAAAESSVLAKTVPSRRSGRRRAGVGAAAAALALTLATSAGAQFEGRTGARDGAAAVSAGDATGDATGVSSGLSEGALGAWALSLLAALTLGAALGRRFGARPPSPRRTAAGPIRPSAPPPGPAPASAAPVGEASGAPQSSDHDAAALLAYFHERFDLPSPDAAAAIAYMERVAQAVARQGERLRAAETRAEALDAALRRAAARAAEPDAPDLPEYGDSASAAWRTSLDGARTIRVAAQALKADPDYAAFDRLVDLEDSVRRLIAEQARAAGGAADARMVDDAWPHAFWRAEALLSAYFPAKGDWGDLRHGVAVVAAALRQLLLIEGVAVGHVRLFAPFDPAEGENWSDSADGLADLRPIRARLDALAAGAGPALDGLVIDCEAFGYTDERRTLSAPARLITFSRAAWT